MTYAKRLAAIYRGMRLENIDFMLVRRNNVIFVKVLCMRIYLVEREEYRS